MLAESAVSFVEAAAVERNHGFVVPEAVKLTESPMLEAVMEVFSEEAVKILPLPAPIPDMSGATKGMYICGSRTQNG